ncbi:MAG: SAM-dependent chlorinase/fluorinase [Deltaproteobacteria bacterium]|nr:SAM-dependent chlorinase/fluorinase [Deltaproteobacteria bacterium]
MEIVLLTDFGWRDGYVGTMKGVIHRISPKAVITDLAHELPNFNILHASMVLQRSYQFFPKNSIFVCIIDPGVGSERKPILVKTKDYIFIAPDNGVLTMTLHETQAEKILYLNQEEYFLQPISQTFHGRDIFSPVAAHIANGVPIEKLGSPLEEIYQLEDIEAKVENEKIQGRVISIDHFGNVITNIKREIIEQHFPRLDFAASIINESKTTISHFCSHYAEGRPSEPIMIFSSNGFLEICLNQSSLEELLEVSVGDQVIIPLS